MKLVIKFLIAILVIGILLPFTILKGKDGNPLLNFADLQSPDLPKLPDSINSLGDESPGTSDTIYKWLDTEGNLQFSNNPPPEGVEYTSMDYDSNLNVIQAIEIKSDESTVVLESEIKSKASSGVEDIGNPYSPEKIEKLFEDANNIEKLLNRRLNNQEAVIGQ